MTRSSIHPIVISFFASSVRGQVTVPPTNKPTGQPTDKLTSTPKWFPAGGSDLPNGYCELSSDYHNGNYGQGYDTNLECCNLFYIGQMSGTCYSKMESPPTLNPTGVGGPDVWYPDYDAVWTEATCKNDNPLPFGPGGRPTYLSMLECCKHVYGLQTSGACFSELENPPTMTPTPEGGLEGYYADYNKSWSDGCCINDRPLPSGRPAYNTMLECCTGQYFGQLSGTCLSKLENPPTVSPTGSDGAEFYYLDYDAAWTEATCKNDLPLPFSPGGRPTYRTKLECCMSSFAGQTSGACFDDLESPPTTSPTGDLENPSTTAPAGDLESPSTTAPAGDLESPSTTAPTTSGGLDEYYPDWDKDYIEGVCTNARPKPIGRTTWDSQADCCAVNYSDQSSHACLCEVDTCHSCKCPSAKTNCSALECEA